MSFEQVLDQLPALTFEERQRLIRRALELDDAPLSDADMELVQARIAAHHADPNTSLPLEKVKAQLRARRKS